MSKDIVLYIEKSIPELFDYFVYTGGCPYHHLAMGLVKQWQARS